MENIGKPEYYRSTYYKYDDLKAGYLRGRLTMVEFGETSALSVGVSFNTGLSEVTSKLGPPSIPDTLTYGYRWDSKNTALIELQGEEELKSVEGRSDFYQLLISTTMYGDLSNIQIVRSDYKAAIMKRIVHNNTIALKTEPAEKLTRSDLAFAPEGTHSFVTLGMSRVDAEKIIGKPTGELFYGLIAYDGLGVGYRDDKVACLIVQQDNESRKIYKSPRGIGLLSSKAVVEKMYGKATTYNPPSINYILVSDGSKDYMRVKKDDEQLRGEYVISMNTSDMGDELVTFLMISDFKFAMTNT